jgi:sialate O-acetylesterase
MKIQSQSKIISGSKGIILMAILNFSSILVFSQQAAIVISPVADAYVWGSTSGTPVPNVSNYGSSTSLQVKFVSGSPTVTRWSFLKFDLSSQGIITLAKATIRLYLSGNGGATIPSTITLSETDAGWTETDITYFNCPKTKTVSRIASCVIPYPLSTGYYEWDITDYLLTKLSTGNFVFSLMLNQDTNPVNQTASFNSRENTSNKPQLVINPFEKVTSITLDNPTANVYVNSQFQLTATVLPSYATNKTIHWTSDNTAVATVDASGLIRGVTFGNATITATTQDGNKIATCNVTVSNGTIPVTGITLSPTSTSLLVGATQQFTATVSPLGATKKAVDWQSDNTNVATVSSTGLVTAKNEGTATITVTTVDGSFSASSAVTVSKFVSLTGVSFSPDSAAIAVGKTFQLTPVYLPLNATNKAFRCVSSNVKVATVDSISGLITGVGAGTTIITLTSQDGSLKADFKISVYGISIKLPNVIGSNMVLQQDMLVPLWGWGPPNESVVITASWGQTATATADNSGKWKAKLQTPKAIPGDTQTKHSLVFSGKNNTVALTNILIGDVYLCAGQSNMVYHMTNVLDSINEINAAIYPNIRLNDIDPNSQYKVWDNNGGSWVECSPTSVPNFSAVAYYFARELYNNKNINIPIGLLSPAVSGSCCQAWVRREALAADAELKSLFLDPYDNNPNLTVGTAATILYNGMIAPIIPFGLKGFVWYQGETNAVLSSYTSYFKLNAAMINDWRKLWGQGDVPFYFVQLPAHTTKPPEFRDQQTNLLTVPNTGMAVTLDLADADLSQIHPHNKKDVGIRLALWAQAKLYGQNVTYTGPFYKSMKVETNKIRISFLPASLGSGLASRNGLALDNFQIAGADNNFVTAMAVIDGNDVLVSANSVSAPAKVAFAYTNTATPNLMNKEGITACPFRTDRWNDAINILSPAAIYNLSINVKDTSAAVIPSVDVTLNSFSSSVTATTDQSGNAYFNNLASGMYSVSATISGYTQLTNLSLITPTQNTGNIILKPLSTGIENHFEDNPVSIYPSNPTDYIHLKLSKQYKTLKIQIVDFTAKLQYSSCVENPTEELSIDLTHFPKGFYIIRVSSQGLTESAKFFLR